MVFGLVNRQKERQALDVIPVRVRQKQGKIERLFAELCQQFLPKQAQSGSGVQYDDLSRRTHFNA